jgi:hypothetical protein
MGRFDLHLRDNGNLTRLISLLVVLAAGSGGMAQTANPVEIKTPSAFASIGDPAARSRALFSEAAKVFTSPRCMNCHPAADSPTQGNDMHPHSPPAARGADGGGIPGNTCGACHMDRNVNILAGQQVSFQSIPGHPRWSMAPIEMAWQGKSIGEICRQLRNPDRNGGRSLAVLYEHVAHDDLVGWGWTPGAGREPAPGTQELLGQLVQAWIDSGAECP